METAVFLLEDVHYFWFVLCENATSDNYEIEENFTALYKPLFLNKKPQVKHKTVSSESCRRKITDSKNDKWTSPSRARIPITETRNILIYLKKVCCLW